MDATRADGISKLMIAEKEAQAIVGAAREEKTARLRAAVEEAKVEIAAYRTEREARYAAMVNEQTGNKVEMDARLKAEFDAEMSALHTRINASKTSVVQDLVATVTNIKFRS